MSRIAPVFDAAQHRTAGPYSPALKVSGGEMLVLSGQGPLDNDGRVVGVEIREQTRVTLNNALRLLELAGGDFSNVFKVNVYLADLEEWEEFNAEYAIHFAEPRPVRTTVGVNLLLGMKVEIELWAAL